MIGLFLAGGSGTRLWPLSRENNPKQLHSLVGDDSLLTQTINRVSPLISPANSWIVTSSRYVDQVATHIPSVPREQIIGEPFALGTNLAVGLGAIHVARKQPDATIVVGWADSYIGRGDAFRHALEAASAVVESENGVILGVRPTFPSTGYGYIRMGAAIGRGHADFFRIDAFEEKPDPETANRYLEAGNYLWNPGISIWKVSKLLGLMKELKPDHYAALQYVSGYLNTPGELPAMEEAFRGLDREPIDTAIFEKAGALATTAADLEWSDIGSWSTLYDVQPKVGSNVIKGEVVTVDTTGCIIHASDRLIATLGVSDLVIVDSGDAILITTREKSDQLKALHSEVKRIHGDKYL